MEENTYKNDIELLKKLYENSLNLYEVEKEKKQIGNIEDIELRNSRLKFNNNEKIKLMNESFEITRGTKFEGIYDEIDDADKVNIEVYHNRNELILRVKSILDCVKKDLMEISSKIYSFYSIAIFCINEYYHRYYYAKMKEAYDNQWCWIASLESYLYELQKDYNFPNYGLFNSKQPDVKQGAFESYATWQPAKKEDIKVIRDVLIDKIGVRHEDLLRRFADEAINAIKYDEEIRSIRKDLHNLIDDTQI